MITLTAGAASEWPAPVQYAVFGLRLALAAFFVLMAARNLAGDEQMAADFARWGYPEWFRQATAWLQLVGALLLLLPATTLFGAVVLGGVLLGAVGTHLMHDPPATLVSPLVFLVLVGVQLLAARPRA